MEVKEFDFKRDLLFGQTQERLIAEQLERLLNTKVQCYNNNGDYDFRLEGCKFEVKTDRYNLNTDCFFVEFARRNNTLSGLNTSKSDYYIFNNTKVIYIMHTIKLIELVRDGTYAIKYTSNSKGYIVPEEHIQNISIIKGLPLTYIYFNEKSEDL